MSRWIGRDREDGYSVMKVTTDNDNWWIMRGDQVLLKTCPCCDKPLVTFDIAAKVCDLVYPGEKTE